MDFEKLEEANRIASDIESNKEILDILKEIICEPNNYSLSLKISKQENRNIYIPLNDEQSLFIVKEIIELEEKELQKLEKQFKEL